MCILVRIILMKKKAGAIFPSLIYLKILDLKVPETFVEVGKTGPNRNLVFVNERVDGEGGEDPIPVPVQPSHLHQHHTGTRYFLTYGMLN